MIIPAVLRTLRTADPDTWAPLLADACAAHGITTPRRVEMFLANVLHETARLHTLRESLNYSVAALQRTWLARFDSRLANTLGRIDGPGGKVLRQADQWWIAEHAYGGRMGNRPPGHGDGWQFRGVGALQTTGYENIAAFARAIRWDKSLPDLTDWMATLAGAAESAATWWEANGCNKLADASADITAVRRRVNGGINGLAEVKALQGEVRAALAQGEMPIGKPAKPVALSKPAASKPAAPTTADLNDASLQKARSLE